MSAHTDPPASTRIPPGAPTAALRQQPFSKKQHIIGQGKTEFQTQANLYLLGRDSLETHSCDSRIFFSGCINPINFPFVPASGDERGSMKRP